MIRDQHYFKVYNFMIVLVIFKACSYLLLSYASHNLFKNEHFCVQKANEIISFFSSSETEKI